MALIQGFVATLLLAIATKPIVCEDQVSQVPIRKTNNGQIQGCLIGSPQGKGLVEQYLGIPYAHPPLGELRYAPPQPMQQLPEDPYQATSYKNSCPQFLDESYGGFQPSDMWNPKTLMSEDCLFLNVWVPTPSKGGRTVMVWIHGGMFQRGTSSLSLYDGKALAAQTDVVVVSFNYRLGIFGFLSTGDQRLKGNLGLWDQVLALQWVRDNIAGFGGNPNSVTVFGEGAGAASIGYLTMSDYGDNLFQRAIFQSGSPDSSWAYTSPDAAARRAEVFLSNVNCNFENSSSELSACLRALTVDEILSNGHLDTQYSTYPWVPTLDGELVTASPDLLLEDRNFSRISIMVGTMENEGTVDVVHGVEGYDKDTDSLLTQDQYLNGIDTIRWNSSSKAKHRIANMYGPPGSGVANREEWYRDALGFISGDGSYTCPTLMLAERHAEAGDDVYAYHLTYRAANEGWPEWMGVVHGSDIQWVFGMPMNQSRNYTNEEASFSRIIMNYWANFAKTGSPNSGYVPTWPPYYSVKNDKGRYQYLEMASAPHHVVAQGGRLRYRPYCYTLQSLEAYPDQRVSKTKR